MALFTDERNKFHRELIEKKVLTFSPATAEVEKSFEVDKVASNADIGQGTSIRIGNGLLDKISTRVGLPAKLVLKKSAGQSLGTKFEEECRDFLSKTFLQLEHLRPGNWDVKKVGARNSAILGKYEQYSHLSDLERISKDNAELRTFLGEAYTVSPDIIISRKAESDADINIRIPIVDGASCFMSALRNRTFKAPVQLLHASLSCKFTMRSDRAQNSRTEALNLLRSRKGRAPHIAVITAEPTPVRIASLALGTGDLDCVYHFALYELRETLEELRDESSLELLDLMIAGKRLKDISDLPLDLAI